MAVINVASDGTLTIDGAVVTPAQVAAVAPNIITDVENFVKLTSNKKNWTVKNIEKLLAWGAGLVAVTNGFSTLTMPTSLRDWLMGSAAIILAAVHISTPAAATTTVTTSTLPKTTA